MMDKPQSFMLRMLEENNMSNDRFSDIAASGIGGKYDGLINPGPSKKINTRICLNETTDAPVRITPKIRTKEELMKELKQERVKYAPFLENYSPSLPNSRFRISLAHFLLNGERNVTVPHYGGPLGYAVSTYETNFDLNQLCSNQAVFICFKGADYRAQVYINGICAGTHEGFFSPFEFDISKLVVAGSNRLQIRLENDFVYMGSEAEDTKGFEGDKLYACTGIGYDDPEVGWHHCPPGMGLYNDVNIEIRNRLHIADVFVRPLIDQNTAEIWAEVYSCDYKPREIELYLSVYGQNFPETVLENEIIRPTTIRTVGVGDSLTMSDLELNGKLEQTIPLLIKQGRNLIKAKVKIKNMRLWKPDEPWLYQAQVRVGEDSFTRSFGMRSFTQDLKANPKGMFYLNGRKIRLRGANTMGFEQLDVQRRNYDQLIDDILLAKLCNMNFWRLTQRPVQEEVYDYCDRLGLMTQTDLPLFGCMRRFRFCEGVRQAEEMELLVRSHPCNVLVTYINEPFPNAMNEPHRHLERKEMEDFFSTCDLVVRLNNPDQIIKHIDGDYDPPDSGMPDNHCYPAWYNGHGIDIGRLHRGYWMAVKPDWYYGCGEFGAEGLDPVAVMRRYYPAEWLPGSAQEENAWSPGSIRCAQTGNFHSMFYDTQDTLDGWVSESQRHQAWAARIMTEAFRRNTGMVSFAIHLFIDAFPSGWMKAIMDCERTPKPAYFEYRNALAPVLPNLRTDKFQYFEGDEIMLEAWVCNDTAEMLEFHVMHIQAELSGNVISAAELPAEIPDCGSKLQGYVSFAAPQVQARMLLRVVIALLDADGNVVNDASVELEVFPARRIEEPPSFEILDSEDHKGALLVSGLYPIAVDHLIASSPAVIVVSDFDQFERREKDIRELVENGAILLFLELPAGEYSVFGSVIRVKNAGMLPMHFTSRATGHPLVEGFQKDDFRLWYDPVQDCIAPILDATFTAEGYTPVLLSGNVGKKGTWGPALATAEKRMGHGCVRICQVKLSGRVMDNPIAWEFAARLFRR
jgi:hypothetical protein